MGISPFQLLIVLLIAVFIFGSGRIKNLGADLGAAIKGFKNEMEKDKPQLGQNDQKIIDSDVKKDSNHV